MCFCTWASPCGSTSASLTSSVSLTEARGLITISSLHSVSDVLGDSARSRNSSRRPLNRILSKRFNMVGTTESSVYLNMTSPPAAKTRTKKNQFANAAPLICGFFLLVHSGKRENWVWKWSYQSIYIPTLTYGHNWKISFLPRMSGLPVRYKVRSLIIQGSE